MSTVVYPAPGELGIERKVDRAVRDLCRSRKRAKGVNGKTIPLSGQIVDKLAQKMVYAASHAGSRPISNRVRRRGAPPDNARIILAFDIREACKELGISAGLRYALPPSFTVDLFNAVAATIWPSSLSEQCAANPRKTFERMLRARITR